MTERGLFGTTLRKLRTDRGLSQVALSERTEEVSASYIALLESGRRRQPSLETIEALAGALDCSDDERARLHLAREGRTAYRAPKVTGATPTAGHLTEFVGRIGELEELTHNISQLLSTIASETPGVPEAPVEERRDAWLEAQKKATELLTSTAEILTTHAAQLAEYERTLSSAFRE